MEYKNKIKRFLSKRRGTSKKWKLLSTITAVLILLLLYQQEVVSIAFVDGEPVSMSEAAEVILSENSEGKLNELIARKVIDLQARKRGIIVTKDEIDSQLKYYRDQARLQGKTLAEIYQDYGTTKSDVVTHAKYRITVYKLFKGDIDVSEDEIDQELKENEWLYELGEEDQIREKLRDRLFQEKLSRKYESFINEAKASSEIDYFINL